VTCAADRHFLFPHVLPGEVAEGSYRQVPRFRRSAGPAAGSARCKGRRTQGSSGGARGCSREAGTAEVPQWRATPARSVELWTVVGIELKVRECEC
jgi:hypothetical protein